MKTPLLSGLSFAGRALRWTPLARSALLNRLHAAVALRLHGSNEVDVGPFRVRFDPRDRTIAKRLVLYRGFEESEIDLLCSFVRPGDCALDVGANIGLHALHLARAVGPEGRVVAVEPDPGNLRLLRANLEANDCHNVIVLPFALGETTGAAQLYVNEVNCGASSLAKPRDDSPSITVTIRRGEEVLKELGLQPSVAKIDVEGAEPAVFRGLGYSPSVLLMEFDSTLLAAHGEDPAQFLHFLLARGYSLEVIDSKSGKCVASTPAEIIAATDQRPVTVHNILAHT